MKLERISENQIRCTLTRSDLAERELKLSELAYGSEKAKALFREMMVQASDELGFEAENIPLIIEAVPISNECIMLIVTKVEDPEELDTRFSKFTPSPEDTEDLSDTDDEIYSSAHHPQMIRMRCLIRMRSFTAVQTRFLTSLSASAMISWQRQLKCTVQTIRPTQIFRMIPTHLIRKRMQIPSRLFCVFMNSIL